VAWDYCSPCKQVVHTCAAIAGVDLRLTYIAVFGGGGVAVDDERFCGPLACCLEQLVLQASVGSCMCVTHCDVVLYLLL